MKITAFVIDLLDGPAEVLKLGNDKLILESLSQK